jgi:hypothetical protein
MKHKRDTFWQIIKHNWTLEQRADLRAAVEAWMAADKTAK